MHGIERTIKIDGTIFEVIEYDYGDYQIRIEKSLHNLLSKKELEKLLEREKRNKLSTWQRQKYGCVF